MYQSFDVVSETNKIASRIAALRILLQKEKVNAILVPRGDEHRGEYVPPSAERLAWSTGFTGSAGLAVIGLERAALFVDGRYTIQAKAQVPENLFEICSIPRSTLAKWIIQNLQGEDVIVGFDPWLYAPAEINRIRDSLRDWDIKLTHLNGNLIDKIWGEQQPKPPRNQVIVHPISYAGVSAEDKIAALQKELVTAKQDATVLTATDSICWLLNIRGSDVAHNPIVLCFVIAHAAGKLDLFIDKAKLDKSVRDHLTPVANILSKDEQTLAARLEELTTQNKIVRIDHETCPLWIGQKLGMGKNVVHGEDLCVAPKAIKNKVEIEGVRAAHLRDGIAMSRFLSWLDATAPSGSVDEISAALQLEAFRQETGKLQEISFDTISGSGPNGAIVHYRVTKASNRNLSSGELYLIDSGAQYKDGTTDITRTIAIGRPTDEMRDRFTRVLKGHIAIATLLFPQGTRGVDLDPFARRALWEVGLDFDHGTGHGVGSYLSVHEGPQSISKRGMAPLKPGMIISNEPGYYKEGAFGIRIENLVLATTVTQNAQAERSMIAFETLTLAPIDRRLIVLDMLTGKELTWLNAYHEDVYRKLSPELASHDQRWLAAACAPL